MSFSASSATSVGSPCSLAQGMISSSSSVISATGNGRRSPCITACEIQRDCLSSFSMLAGVRFLPPAVMMMSFIRPVIFTKPSSSISPTSPVRNQPSPVNASRVASSLRQYSLKTLGPFMSSSPSSPILTSMPGAGLPTVPNLKASGVLTQPMPVVSVSPQPSSTVTPQA